LKAVIPQLLLLTGAPASGKSTLAARLAQRYGACVCSKDEIKELLFDTLGAQDRRGSSALSDASFAMLFAFAARLLCAERLLLLEGNFRPGEHESALAAALPDGAVEFAQVLCRAGAATCLSRLAARASDPSRHPGHRDRELDPATARVSGFLELAGPRWYFDSDGPGEEAWVALCRHMDRWCAKRPPPARKP
jgi:predicted kinase